MRLPSFPQFVRAFHTISNTTSTFIRSNPAGTLGRTFYNSPQRVTLQRSMPNIPFLGALFGSSSSMADNTNYAVSKPEGEWQAQLSPGTSSAVYPTLEVDAVLIRRRAIPRPPQEGHRSAWLEQAGQALPRHRSLQLRRLLSTSIQSQSQIRLWVWMAGLLGRIP